MENAFIKFLCLQVRGMRSKVKGSGRWSRFLPFVDCPDSGTPVVAHVKAIWPLNMQHHLFAPESRPFSLSGL